VEIHHRPVLLEEVLSNLVVGKAGLLVDGTMGEGGHSSAVLRTLLRVESDWAGPGSRYSGQSQESPQGLRRQSVFCVHLV
jgi:hypothetical protein